MELIIFLITSLIAIIGAVAMLVSPNAVHSALFLLLNFAAIAVIFLLLQAPFLFAIQLSVYAGAIMVLFLFVVMLLGAERAEDEEDTIGWQKPLALALALVLLIESVIISIRSDNGMMAQQTMAQTQAENFGAPAPLGEILFTKYLLPFELVGIILLVAIIGVVVLNRGRMQERKPLATSTTITETDTHA